MIDKKQTVMRMVQCQSTAKAGNYSRRMDSDMGRSYRFPCCVLMLVWGGLKTALGMPEQLMLQDWSPSHPCH